MSRVINVDLIGRYMSSGSQRRKSGLPQMLNRTVKRPSDSALYARIRLNEMTFAVPEGKW
jgi:hypothetical protein